MLLPVLVDHSIFKVASSSLRYSTRLCLTQQINAYRVAASFVLPLVTRNKTFSVRFLWSGAGSNPFQTPYASASSCTSTNPYQPKSQEEKEKMMRSVDDFPVKNIFVCGVPFFSETAMVTCRVSPALFDRNSEGKFVAQRDGTLSFRFAPRSKEFPQKYDYSKSFRVRIRATDVGTLLEIDAQKVESPITIAGLYGRLHITAGENEGTLKLKGIPHSMFEDGPEYLEVEISTGQFKTLQTLLFHASPALFGWQLLADPRILNQFLNPVAVTDAKSFLDN